MFASEKYLVESETFLMELYISCAASDGLIPHTNVYMEHAPCHRNISGAQ
jgi:hypothetical protein